MSTERRLGVKETLGVNILPKPARCARNRGFNHHTRIWQCEWRSVWGGRQTGTLQTGKGYCANLGHPEDETGLVYMRARYYEPTTGRFISEDPARDGVNWYLYADGNPVNRIDSSGNESLSELIGTLWFFTGLFTMLSAGVVGGGPTIAYAEMMAAYGAVKQVWSWFSFSLALQIGLYRIMGWPLGKFIGGFSQMLTQAIIDAFAATFQMVIEAGIIDALTLRGGARIGLIMMGYGMMLWGALLWTEVE
jgi:RHS repeat-associated protein